MILTPLDPGAAFDTLSILAVKIEHNIGSHIAYTSTYDTIRTQIGDSKMTAVVASKEYMALIQSNRDHFDLEESARYNDVPHAEIRKSNMQRFQAKKTLQAMWFTEQGSMLERKTME